MPEQQELASGPGSTPALTCLGAAALERVSDDGSRVSLVGPGKPLALFVYLACSPGRSASRDHLVDLLWGDVEPERARANLRHTLWILRDHLGESAIHATDGNLHLAVSFEFDRDAFLAAVEGRDFEAAAELYRGEFLPGFAAPGAADFEQWADRERYHLRYMFLRAAETVVRDWLSKGRLRKAKQLATRARDADPTNEIPWRLLLESLLAAEDRVTAELEAHELEQLLRAEARPPEPATLRLLERVRAGAGEGAPRPDEAPARTLVAELIGREREFGAILGAWERARHGPGQHVHVAGGAGLGKTRLLADVHARLSAMGTNAIFVRANPGERQVSYALASDLALAAASLPGAAAVSPGVPGTLVAINPSLSSRYATVADRAVGTEALRRREIALRELLAAVAYEHPVAVLIDDVHWADAMSRQLLRSLLGKLGDHHTLVVTSGRPGPEGAITSAATLGIALEALSVEETGALVASLGTLPSQSWSARFASELHKAAQGSPLLVLETLRWALESEVLVLHDGVWECPNPLVLAAELARGGALRRRIEELERNEGWVLLLLSVAGTPLDATLLAKAAGRSLEVVLANLAALEVRGLSSRDGDAWQPAHDEIAAHAIDVASPDARRAAHRAVGEALAGSAGRDVSLLYRAARHLATAAEGGRLREVFSRWSLAARRLGDRRSLKVLAADVLGGTPGAADAPRLARSAPLPLRLGLYSRRRILLAALVGAALVAGGAIPLLKSAPPPPDAEFIVAEHVTGDSFVVRAVPVWRDRWESVHSQDAGRFGRTYPDLSRAAAAGAATSSGLIPSPDGQLWAFARVVSDSGGNEIFLADPRGRERRLTYSPKDDFPLDWSPDGRSLVFGTGRWNVSGRDNLAVLDVATGRARQLTRGDNSDGNATWSHDGTRIAFVRTTVASGTSAASVGIPTLLCWISVRWGVEQCFATVPVIARVFAWYDSHQVLASVADTSGALRLARVNLDDHTLRVLTADMTGNFSASRDGRWVGCSCQRAGMVGWAWYVFPTDRPDLAIPVAAPSSAPVTSLTWQSRVGQSGYLDHLRLVLPATALTLDGLAHLRAMGYDGAGRAVGLPVLSWRSADTTVASVDSATGAVHPHRVGSVLVYASAGGWRTDSARIVIGVPTFRVSLNEDWRDGLAQWVAFGQPLPAVTDGPDGQPAFWNNGDASFYSGAYTRRAFLSPSGLGLEFTVWSPITAFQDQLWIVSLAAWTDSAAVARWDHRTGSIPLGESACTFAYPSTDGPPGMRDVAFSSAGTGRRVAVDPAVATRKPYRVRIQVFADGECGLAIDGKPLYLAPGALLLSAPYHVILQGKSVGTKMLIGHLEVWEGVKSGVNWARVSR